MKIRDQVRYSRYSRYYAGFIPTVFRRSDIEFTYNRANEPLQAKQLEYTKGACRGYTSLERSPIISKYEYKFPSARPRESKSSISILRYVACIIESVSDF